MQLPVPNIDRVNRLAPRFSRTCVKPRSMHRRPDKRGLSDGTRNGRERLRVSARPVKHKGAPHSPAAWHQSGFLRRLRTTFSFAVTRPASIAACALARLSNRPRSTSRRSTRCRGALTGGIIQVAPRNKVLVHSGYVMNWRRRRSSGRRLPRLEKQYGTEIFKRRFQIRRARDEKRKKGTLRSGRSGRRVKSRKQAIAIGLSEARKQRKESATEKQDLNVRRV